MLQYVSGSDVHRVYSTGSSTMSLMNLLLSPALTYIGGAGQGAAP